MKNNETQCTVPRTWHPGEKTMYCGHELRIRSNNLFIFSITFWKS